MKKLYSYLFSIIAILFSYSSSAQLTGGKISLDSTTLLVDARACTKGCDHLPFPYVPCYPRAINFQTPTGGSGQYVYSWEKQNWYGGWYALPDTTRSINISLPPKYPDLGEYNYYRRKVKDVSNLTDSAWSNIVQLGSFSYYHGNLTLGSSGDWVATVLVGTQSPSLRTNAFTLCPGGYVHVEQKINSGTWGYYAGYSLPQLYIPTQIRNTPDTVYYRAWAEGYCADYDTTYSNLVTVYFINPQNFDPGNITSNVNKACPGRIINLTGTPTNALSYYPYYKYFWQSSLDSITWTYIDSSQHGTTQNYSDSSFTTTKYYRRGVETGPGWAVIRYSNVVKVKKKNTGCIAIDPGTIIAGTPTCTGVQLTGTPATSPSAFQYLWQYSNTNGYTWLNGPATIDFYDSTYLPNNKYYRRLTISDSIIRSGNVLHVTAYPISSGKPDSIGRNQWLFACYNGYNNYNAIYRGFYISDSLGINTAQDWPDTTSPSYAAGYSGCSVDTNQFNIAVRRKGFPSGTYQARIITLPGYTYVYKNNSYLFGVFGYDPQSFYDLGHLDSTTKLEIPCSISTGNVPLFIDLIKVGPRPSSYIDSACHTFSLVTRYNDTGFHDIIDTLGNPIAAVNTNNVQLGLETVKMKHSAPGVANIPTDASGKRYMPRHFDFQSENYIDYNFPSPVRVRLYFLNSEFDDFKAAINKPTLDISQLRIAHYNGTNEDCDRNNNTAMGSILSPVAYGPFGSDAFYLDVDVNSFSEFGVTDQGSILPLKWLYASAERKKQEVFLQWKVAGENADSKFDILRSKNGADFITIASIKGTGNASATTYSYKDSPVDYGDLYYQIKVRSRDGKYNMSSVMKVKAGEDRSFQVYPNPVTDGAEITSSSIMKQLMITDASGRQILVKSCLSTFTTLPTAQLNKGIYFLKVTFINGEIRTVKIIKE